MSWSTESKQLKTVCRSHATYGCTVYTVQYKYSIAVVRWVIVEKSLLDQHETTRSRTCFLVTPLSSIQA